MKVKTRFSKENFNCIPTGIGIMNFKGEIFSLNDKAKTFYSDCLGLDFENISQSEDEPLLTLTAFMEKEDQKHFFQEMLSYSSGEIQLDTLIYLVKSQTLGKMPIRIIADKHDETAGFDSFLTLFISAENEDIHRNIQINLDKISCTGKMTERIAHEINNPLMIIQGCSDMIKKSFDRKSLDPLRLEKYTHRLNENISRLSQIISALQCFSREKKQDELQKTSLSSLIDESLQICKSEFDLTQVNITVNTNELELDIYCRKSELVDAVFNVIKNAILAALEYPTKWVSIELEGNKELAIVRVKDPGLGIPKEIAEKVLDPFFTTRPIGRGLGLGLSYSHTIINSHQGRIFYNPISNNTEFVIELPQAKYIEKNLKKVS
jgi:signal transduction histidine kinase